VADIPINLNTDSAIVIDIDLTKNSYILADELTLVEVTDSGDYNHDTIKIYQIENTQFGVAITNFKRVI